MDYRQVSFLRILIRHSQLQKKIQAGSVQINGRTERGPDHFPFIGTKGSGMGTQGVRRSIESMTREKVTVININ